MSDLPVRRERREVVIVGGGPGGLGVAAPLNGWRPTLRRAFEYPVFAVTEMATTHADDLLAVDQHEVMAAGLRPIEFFRMLHHPQQRAVPLDDWVLDFEKGDACDWIMLTVDPPGGLWNDVPTNQLTLGPAHWMELAPYPMERFQLDSGRRFDLDDLAHRDNLVSYYEAFADRMELAPRIRQGVQVESIAPSLGETARFDVTACGPDGVTVYECDYVVFAVGPKSRPRRLGVPGEDCDYVSHRYQDVKSSPGERVLVIGGGRSADWAATELHDDGRNVVYVMRQAVENHWRLINESQNLPYYRRIARIIQGGSSRFGLLYDSRVVRFHPDHRVELETPEGPITVEVDSAVLELGGEADYGLLQAFPDLALREKRDDYRYQLMQMRTDQATFESVAIPGLYPAGYLAEGTGLSVIGFHAGAYLIAGDILRRLRGRGVEGRFILNLRPRQSGAEESLSP